MNEFETPEVECIDTRDARALTDYLLTYEEADGLFTVAGEGGDTYTVDTETGACTCPDAEYRSPAGGCKHYRRVQFETRQRSLPEWADRDAVDPLLAAELDDVAAETTDETRVATDGGTEMIVAGDEGEILDEDGAEAYTEHVEPRGQGGETYVRCRDCARELLVSRGGWDLLTHTEDCRHA